jgi:hypothetical protein
MKEAEAPRGCLEGVAAMEEEEEEAEILLLLVLRLLLELLLVSTFSKSMSVG